MSGHMEQAQRIIAVQRMQRFIEENLNSSITLHQLAQAAGYSPWHAARIFKALTGKTPFDYIRALRLSHAAVRLRSGSVKVVDVAFDFVFDSHEGFTRAFSRQFGISPQHYARGKLDLPLFFPHVLHEPNPDSIEGENKMSDRKTIDTIFVQVVERPARRLILKRGIKAEDYYAYCDEVGCEVWEVLCGIKDALYEPMGMWLPESLRKPGTSVYAQGVEVPAEYSGAIPEELEMIDLPACKMMIFQGKPYDDSAYEEAIGNFWETIKRYDPEIYGFKWADEDGPRFQFEPQGYRGYIEGRPVRTANP